MSILGGNAEDADLDNGRRKEVEEELTVMIHRCPFCLLGGKDHISRAGNLSSRTLPV